MGQFDLEKTAVLGELFQTAREQRDDEWRSRFVAAIPDATLISFDPQVQQGPDTFPYFQLAMPAPGTLIPFCVSHILDACLENGFGVAIFGDASRSSGPEWVFSYGDLLSYSMYGRFYVEPEPRSAGGEGKMLVASPSEQYYPARARRALGNFLRNVYHHPAPKLGLIDSPVLTPARNLVVNLKIHEHYHGNKQRLDAAMGYVRWFVPSHYGLMSLPPEVDDSGFADL
jgi:hypothetical protein